MKIWQSLNLYNEQTYNANNIVYYIYRGLGMKFKLGGADLTVILLNIKNDHSLTPMI